MVTDVLGIVRTETQETIIEEMGGGEHIQTVINTGDTAAAEKLLVDVIEKYLSEDSKYFFTESRKAISKISFTKEWAIGA